jgi:hypothetical protein
MGNKTENTRGILNPWLVPMAMVLLLLHGCATDRAASPEAPATAPARATTAPPVSGPIPRNEFPERAQRLAASIAVPDGYDLHADRIQPAAMDAADLEFGLRFRAVCLWTHFAVRAGAGPGDGRLAARHVRDLTSPRSFRETGQAQPMEGLARSLEQGDNGTGSAFLVYNCRIDEYAGAP